MRRKRGQPRTERKARDGRGTKKVHWEKTTGKEEGNEPRSALWGRLPGDGTKENQRLQRVRSNDLFSR